MSRVIQDSDDELEGSPSPIKEQVQPNKSPMVKATLLSDDLLRGIHAAQDASVAAGTISMLDGAGTSPPVRSASTEPSSSKRRKTIRTYESSSKRSKTLILAKEYQLSTVEPTAGTLPPTDQDNWLPPTLRGDFAGHEPHLMFSELSSTVPDNTMTQQRIIKQAIEATESIAALATQSKSEHTQISDSSIPWSAYKDAHQVIVPSPHIKCPEAEPTQPSLPASSQDKRRSQTYAHSDHSSQTMLRISQDERRDEHSELAVKAKSASESPKRSRISMPNETLEMVPEPASLISHIEVADTAAKEGCEQPSDNTMANQSKRRRKDSELLQERAVTSDELWVGLPKEQYKPRSSRSRSAKVTDGEYLQAVQQTLKPKSKRRKTTLGNPDDPEKPLEPILSNAWIVCDTDRERGREGKLVSCESKTALREETNVDDENHDENKENEAPRIVSPSSSAKAQAQHSRPVLVEVSIPPPFMHVTKQKSLAGAESDIVDDSLVEMSVLKAIPKVPSSSGTRKKTKARRSQTAATPGFSQRRKVFDSDDSDSDVSPVKSMLSEKNISIASPLENAKSLEMPPPPVPSTAPEKKKGRGRPRKENNSQTISSSSNSEADTSSKQFGDNDDTKPQDVVRIGRSAHRIHDSIDEDTLPQALDQDNLAGIQKQASTKTLAAAPSTPEELPTMTPTTATKTPELKGKSKSPTNHSPINKGKVPYRVGLSRRSRIAPLLRIIKK